MAGNSPKSTTARGPGRVKSSIVLRLNTRLFFRLLGIYVGMNLLLVGLFLGGTLFWAERQCAEVATLVEQRGVPSPEATAWMAAGDYTVAALERPAQGWQPAGFLPVSPHTELGLRSLRLPEEAAVFGPWHRHPGRGAGYRVELPNGGAPYAITLDLERPLTVAVYGLRIFLVCQLISLICNLFKNAGTIKKVLRPIQELAAAAAKLGTVSTMSPEELQALAGKLEEINASHLDTRISVSGTQRELKTLAEAINSMLDRINEAYRSQMRFVSDASHELRTPIAIIQGYANLLNRWGKDDPATRQEAIEAITAEATAMKELVEQLLFLARGDNDSMHVTLVACDLTAVAAEVWRETEMIDETHVFSAKWDGAVRIRADVGLMKQALRILVDNSMKYTPAGGRITLTVAARDGMARLSVQDEGQGITAQALPHIFDRFYRTDESRARQTGGTGLGLAIAKWIVDRHGGHFEILSRDGIGTRMTIVFPLAAAGQEGEGRQSA